MNFMGMGPAELILILVIALIVFGPGKLTEIGGTLGRTVREFRKAANEMTQELQQSVQDVRQPIDEIRRPPLDQQSVVTAQQSYGANNAVCPSCTAPNPKSNKFCGHCGADLMAPEIHSAPAVQIAPEGHSTPGGHGAPEVHSAPEGHRIPEEHTA